MAMMSAVRPAGDLPNGFGIVFGFSLIHGHGEEKRRNVLVLRIRISRTADCLPYENQKSTRATGNKKAKR